MSATVEKKFSERLRAYLLKSVRSSGIVSLPKRRAISMNGKSRANAIQTKANSIICLLN